MGQIVLATANPHKVAELNAILSPLGIEVMGLQGLPGGPFQEPRETGSTFEQNAAIKALSYAAQTGRLCLADDSGLEIDALDGRPGVISSHYSTDGLETGMSREQRDRANNERVLLQLQGVPPDDRGARFVCCMCLAEPPTPGFPEGRILARSRGVFEGRIGVPPRVPAGLGGFGYDPLFLVTAPPHHGAVTSAELPTEEKHRLSHRGSAAAVMCRQIKALGLG